MRPNPINDPEVYKDGNVALLFRQKPPVLYPAGVSMPNQEYYQADRVLLNGTTVKDRDQNCPILGNSLTDEQRRWSDIAFLRELLSRADKRKEAHA